MKSLLLKAMLATTMAATLPKTKTTDLLRKGVRRKLRPCSNPKCNKKHDNKNSFCCAKCHAEAKQASQAVNK